MSGGFSFGQNAFSFGTPRTTAPAATPAGGFGFGAAAPTVAPAPAFSGFSQQRAPVASATGFSFGATAPIAAAPSTGFSFGPTPAAAPVAATPAGGFSFGATPAAAPTAAAPAGGFSFGSNVPSVTTAAPATGFSFGAAPAATIAPAPATGFGFGGAPAAQPAPAAPATNTGFSFGGAAPVAAATTSAAPPGGFSFGNASAAPINLSATSTSGGFGGLGGGSSALGGGTGGFGGLGANPLGGTGGFGVLGSGTTALGGFGGLGGGSSGFSGLGGNTASQTGVGGLGTTGGFGGLGAPTATSGGISGGFSGLGSTSTLGTNQGGSANDQGSLASLLGGPSQGFGGVKPSDPTSTAASSFGGFGPLSVGGGGLATKPASSSVTVAANPLLSGLTAATTTAAGASPFSFAGLGSASTTGGLSGATGSNSLPTNLTARFNSAAGAAGTTPASTTAASSGLGSLTGFKPAALTTAAAITVPGLSVGGFKSTVSQAAPVLGGLLSGPSAVTTAAAADAKAPALTASCMTYRNLEDSINKWTVELEEQEAIFLDQATQVNAWDRLLIDNADKITQLNTDVEGVKLDQQHLDYELDFILAQQRELEDLLAPLEESVAQLPPIHYQQHADLEREHTYKLAESVDSQLKQMSLDLKEIVEHINASSSAQDSADPLVQITKILNSHMDSLNWIDQNTGLLQRRVEEVSRQANTQKAHQENNMRLAFK